MGRRRHLLVVLVAAAVVSAACAADPGVRSTASERSPVPTAAPTTTEPAPATTPPPPMTPPSTVAPSSTTIPPARDIAFGPCDDFVRFGQEAPNADWECGMLTLAMDPTATGGDTIDLAVTRLRGTRSRGTPLVINPGGPGGAGLPFAWALADLFPPDILRLYDIVSWDPRGVGSSEPAITCPRGSRWSDPRLLERCGDATGALVGFMSTPHHVADLDALRVALGQDRLDYVGYSYGTYLGGLYADRYPDHVGRFVLDGAVDPDSGTARAPFRAGEPWYASDESDAVERRFFDLCDAAAACELGTDSAASFDSLSGTVDELPTDDFPGEIFLDQITLDAVLDNSMFDPFNWGILATALEDAAAGDASSLDALADMLEVSDAYFGDVVDMRFANETIANFTIYCADFAEHPSRPAICDGVPSNDFGTAGVVPVDVDTPILVIGTQFDPSTPGDQAALLADALGDATELYWDGIGHTAFPFNSLCIDDAVTQYLLDGVQPPDGERCDFVEGFDSDELIGDYLFELPPTYVEPWIETELTDEWAGAASCLAEQLSTSGDRIVVHLILGVSSPGATTAIEKAVVACDDRVATG